MESTTKLINTRSYSLIELFATTNSKIVIPDFQRDYCWGDTIRVKNRDRVIASEFLETLIDENFQDETLLGKIDVYKDPAEYIYLTDGQQRITTLYLLIGMLYKQTKNEVIKSCLISKEKENSDKEPYLQYAIRESSIFFLRDLVNEFFIKRISLKVKSIVEEFWFFNEYHLDPTINSMLATLKIIELKLEELTALQLNEFADFLVNRVKIQYYDVDDRKNGEERFVIINTTGKSLTVSENIKPILLGQLHDEIYPTHWEERETWFWKNRNKAKQEQIADDGIDEFLTWCFQIIEKQDPIDLIKKSKEIFKKDIQKLECTLILIQSYFTQLKRLITILDNEPIQRQFQFINDNSPVTGIIGLRNLTISRQQNLLLPLLAFMERISSGENDVYQFLRRLRKNYFDNEWERDNNHVGWKYILQIIENSRTLEECLNFDSNFMQIGKSEIPTGIWYNQEEKIKDELKKKYKDIVEKWEDHIDFMGDLSFLFSTIEIHDIEDNRLKNGEIVHRIECCFKNYCDTIDLIRTEGNAEANPILSNYFRLFRIFIGCNQVSHIYKASWDFEGVPFSTLNRVHLDKPEFKQLCKGENASLKEFCINYIKTQVDELDLFTLSGNNFSVDKFIKCWLTLKVFYADITSSLLHFWERNGTGVAAYIDMDSNRLVERFPFDLENSICGFGVKSGFGGGNYIDINLGQGSNPCFINAPFVKINQEPNGSDSVDLSQNKQVIDSIIKFIKTE